MVRMPPTRPPSDWCRCAAAPIRRRTSRRAVARIEEAARRGAQDRLPAGAVPLAVLLPARGHRDSSTSPSRFPGRAPRRSARGARQRGVVVVASLFEKRAEGVFHNTAVRDRRRRLARRALPQDAHPRRSALLREVLLHARRPRLPQLRHARAAASARWSAGISGFPKRRGSRRCAAPRSSSIPTAIGWHPREKDEYGAAQHDGLGDDPARATRSPTASSSPPSTASASRAISSSGAARSSPIRSAASWRAPATTARRCWSSTAIAG